MQVNNLRSVTRKSHRHNPGSCVSILVHFSNGTCLKCYLRGVIGRGQSVIFLRESPDIGCQSVCMTEFGLFLKKANFIFPQFEKHLSCGYIFYFARKFNESQFPIPEILRWGRTCRFREMRASVKLTLYCLFDILTVTHAMVKSLREKK